MAVMPRLRLSRYSSDVQNVLFEVAFHESRVDYSLISNSDIYISVLVHFNSIIHRKTSRTIPTAHCIAFDEFKNILCFTFRPIKRLTCT